MFIISSKNFEKEVAKLPAKIVDNLKNRLALFKLDPFNEIFNNHKLKGSLQNFRSINITGDYRLFYEQYDENTVRLIRIGTHSELYGK